MMFFFTERMYVTLHILYRTISQKRPSSMIVDKIEWKYTWTIRVYFKRCHWTLLISIHVSKLRTSSSNKNIPVGKVRK